MFVSRRFFFRTVFLSIVAVGRLLSSRANAEMARGRDAPSKPDRKASEDWTTYGGSTENIKYSGLTQITPQNIGSLRVAWTYSSGEASDTNKTDMKTNPLVVSGTLYGLNPQLRLFALDAATGTE